MRASRLLLVLLVATTVAAPLPVPGWAAALGGEPGAAVLSDQEYGPDPAQLADVYLPAAAPPQGGPAPILLVVHGGSWKGGDKATSDVVQDKLAYWLPQGYVVISVNTRVLPQARPAEQAEDLGLAVAWIHQQAARWRADPDKLVVMGHSSGGHLVTLLAADAAMRQRTGAPLWRASIILDGAGFDLLDVMPRPHAPFYDEAFGANPAEWAQASPAAQLSGTQPPALFVCSTLRPDPCRRAQRYANMLKARGGQAELFGLARNHAQVNSDVGADNDATQAINAFITARIER